MGKITFILGGARSGKSTLVLNLAKKYKKVAFIATCQVKDKEMKQRINLHRMARSKHWQTFEEPRDLSSVLQKIKNNTQCLVIDCLTLLLSNLILAGESQALIEKKIRKWLRDLKMMQAKIIVVSNEVGLGIVPASKLGRDFRDIAGRINQLVASESKEVFFMLSGLPIKLKGKR